MCGIAVALKSEGAAPRLPLEKLRHRGPDASGEWRSSDRHVWFGHARLAILDLSPAGAQPMQHESTGNVIAFNGEIYNHLALRRELSASEQNQWQGTSDTETLLTAYHTWGKDMLPRLKGMFAFALYDTRQRQLLLARDRFGIKPLYYIARNGSFFAASEIRALPLAPDKSVPPLAVANYLRWGACPEHALPFPEARILPAGHWLSVSLDTGSCRTGSYWPPAAPIRSESDNPGRRLRRLLETAVREHLLADVPVASFLSGGIDSSIITALAARQVPGCLRTFSVGFREAEFDETEIALEVARRFGTEHTRIELDEEETIAIVLEAVEKLDLPSVDAINTYIVSKKVAGQGIKVALSGLGGDELFGGYPSFRDVPWVARLAAMPVAVRRSLRWFGPTGRRLAEIPDARPVGLAQWRRCFWTDAMLANVGLPSPGFPNDHVPDLPDSFSQISWAELTHYMRHLLLRDSDQMSMAVSLELRVPFLDHELVEFVLGLPASAKRGGSEVKSLLIESCRDLLPSSVYQRPKQGFALPMDAWMRGALKGVVTTWLQEASDHCGLKPGSVERLRLQFERKQLHWTRLWSLAILGHYLHGKSSEPSRPPCAQEPASPECESFALSAR
jgi:asparagine synthase (glutamine-hydrolysing)